MLVWATEFPAATGKSADDLLPLAKEWLVGSPHTEWTHAHFKKEPLGEVTTYRAGGQTVAIARVEANGQRWAGVQQKWIENGEHEWTTEIVGHEHQGTLWISVRLDCNRLLPGLTLPIPKKPYFLKPLFERLGGGYDGILPIGNTPIVLSEDEVDLAASLMLGTARTRLPVVYVSMGGRGFQAVDVKRLSKWLAGMAHVVVEPSRAFSFPLSRHVGGTNAYGGAVGIYWPGGVGEPAVFRLQKSSSKAELEREIEGQLRIALIRVRPRSEGTWAALQEALSHARLDQLRAMGSTKVEEYVEAFDAELTAKQQRLDEADAEIRRLEAEIRRYHAMSREVGEGFLKRGDEQDYYPGEMRDAVVKGLTAGRASLVPDSRWAHLVDAVLNANAPSAIHDEVVAELKNALSKMSKFGGTEKRALESVGFSVTEAGKHVKAVYFDDERYMITVPKTPGDHRAGKNLVSDITRTIFG